MKKIFTLAFCLYVMPSLFAQSGQHYDPNSNWFFGFNVGAAWNSTDIKNETNAGWGFTFGRSFNTRPEALFSWDLRMRYLQGTWYGQDFDTTNLTNYNPAYMPNNLQEYKDNPGYTVNNFSARNHHLGLELVLHANRLRQRTGWDPYIFGGANIVWNQTFSDLQNSDSSFGAAGQYVYDPTFINDAVINSTLDGLYETEMNPGSIGSDYNLEFMPSIGIGLAYYFGPRFALGVEHKSTFTRKDDWDGFEDATPGLWGRSNDIYHYTNGFLRFHLRASDAVRNNTTNNIVNCEEPEIALQRPSASGTTVQDQIYAFRARVEHINSIQNITVRVNGVESNNFFYSTTTRTLEGSLVLTQGANQIQVVATNSCGTDMETVVINYEDCRAPIVNITEPSQRSINVESPTFRVRASIANGGNINYTVNGAVSSNFIYNQSNGNFESTLNLVEGTNTVVLTVTNDCGSDTETITINYTDCEDPRVNFLAGNGSVLNVNTRTALIRASVFGIDNVNAIGLRVNGANRPFNYNAGSRQLEANINLNAGANVVQITVGNECGTDLETITVNYTPCTSPQVNILTPIQSGITTQNGTQRIEASVTNATNVSQIQMLVNGVQVAGGSYNPITRIYTNNAALNAGTNIIQIVVSNDCGSDSETTTVIYQVNCPEPVISLASAITNTHQSVLPVQYVVQNVTSASQVQMRLNGVAVQGGYFNSQTNVFSATLALSEGANTITITATNNCGSDSETIVVYYTEPCDDPEISMINPIGNQTSVSNARFDVQAILENISNSSQVQVSVNGALDVSGSYNSITQLYHNSVTLQPGANTVIMTVDNGCSSETEIFVINYSPCLQPVVSITSPSGGSTQNDNVLVTATVLNVDDANNIELVVNGSVYTGSYNPNTGTFQSNVPLNSGNNSIQIIATNDCGSITQSVSLTYAPCTAPNVQLVTTPRGLSQNQNGSIQALVTGVSGAGEIVATHNGNTVQGTYNASTNMFSVNVTLTNGLNTITITASNDCGTDSQSTIINYTEPCDAPQVSITSPANGSNAPNASVQLTASVSNVNSANEVQLIVNGSAQQGSLNTSTGTFTANLNLQQGANIIQVMASNACGSATETITVLYRPCLAPTIQLLAPQAGISANPTTTLQALILNAGSANNIGLTVNGAPISGTYNTATNMFTASIALVDGTNNIVVSVNTNCGNDSKSVSVTYDKPCDAPQLSIASPLNGAQVATNTVDIAASVLNVSNANGIQLLVNGSAQSGTFNLATGAFTATVPLQNGNNAIEVIATNECGTTTESINVTYSPCVTPRIQIVAPLQPTTTNASVTFKAVVMGVNGAGDISVTLNGSPVTGSFNSTTGMFTAPLTLTSGLNTLEIQASNSCGSDDHTLTITYNEPCTAPEIAFTTPVNGTVVGNNSIQVSATVTGASGAGSVQLTVNGIQQYVAIVAGQNTMNANVNLNQGVNAIVLTATNACGTTTETLNVTYTPCVAPSVNITAPSAGNSASETVNVVASITGVSGASAVQATHNGSGVNGSYDAASNTFSVPVTLSSGTNTITIEATNECGMDGATLTLTYNEPCDPPTVTITAPVDGETTSASQINLVATITNVSNASQVEVEVNGDIVSGGSYDSNTNTFTTTVPLTKPINKIVVAASNDCGDDSQRVFVSQETEPTMVICHYPPGNTTNPQQMEIPISAWPAHQAHGDTQGPCRTSGSGSGVINNNGNGQGSSQQSGNSGGTQTNTYGGQTGGGLIQGGSGSSGSGTGGTTGGNTGGGTTGGGDDNGGGTGTGGRIGNDQNGGSDALKKQKEAEEAAKKKAAEEAAKKRAAEEAAKKKAAEEAAKKKAAEEAAKKRAAEEAAKKRAAEEAAKKKAAEEAAKKRAAEEAAKKKAAEEAAKKRAAEEAAKKKAAEEAAKKRAAEEAAKKRAAEEAAKKKAAEEAAKKKAAEEAAKKKAAEEAAKKKAAEEAAKKKAEEVKKMGTVSGGGN
jgi:hypothetical protein